MAALIFKKRRTQRNEDVTEKIVSVLFLPIYHTGSEADFGIFFVFFAITPVDLDIREAFKKKTFSY